MNSSAATTVMLVGVVNVGVISLAQATTIIMGANIGTTVSAQIFAFSGAGDGLSVTGIFALISLIGLLLTMIAKKDRLKQLGNIMIGIGFIFIGLKFLSTAVGGLVDNDYWGGKIEGLFISLGKGDHLAVWQMLLLFILGMVLTAAMQSSAAMTGLVISLAGQGLITMNMAIFITLGSNIGTCFTSIIASFGTNVNARRTALVHLSFNVIGGILFIIPMLFVQGYVADFLLYISSFGSGEINETVVQHAVAHFHLAFNVITTLLLLPFTDLLVKFVSGIIPPSKEESLKNGHALLHFIDPRFLESPPIAVPQVRKEILGMGNLAFANYKRSLKMLTELDFSEKTEFDKTEDTINDLNKSITSFCIKLSSKDLSIADEKKISAFFRNVSDLERIGDYAQNITEYAERLKEDNGNFSADALAEIEAVDEKITVLFNAVMECFENRNLNSQKLIDDTENDIDRLTDDMQAAHIERMNEGLCNPATGALYLQLSGNLERIADHMVNVAKSVKTYVKKS
ncbi:MAG: Na/Pi cotransporter family protein, partial [Clostridia bacterium]|nr:Na/Pi cotransporter family protein [Clostridia bacterium]